MSVLDEVNDERAKQDEQWGSKHDDTHTAGFWTFLVMKHLGKVADAVCEDDYGTARHKLIVVAALAIAAVESLDRQLVAEAR